MQEEVLRMQLHALQQKQRAVKIQPFYVDFKGKPTDRILFLEKLSLKVNHHFQGSRFFFFNRGNTSINILTSYETVSTTDVLTHLSTNHISFDDDEMLYESIINSLHHSYHNKITSRLTMARRDGRQSGVLATLLIAKDCSLQRKSGHILAEEYSKITLARSKNNIIYLCGEFNRRFQELKQHGWDITANGKHADPVFREFLLFPSPAFTSVIAPEFAKFSNLPLHMRHTYDIHELFSIATKNFTNLPVTSAFDNTAFDETSNLSALTSALTSLQRHTFHHLLIPIKASNPQPQQKGQTNLDQKGATLYGATHINMNPSLTPSTTVRQFDSAKFTNGTHHTATTSVTSKIILHLHTHNK